MSLFTPFPSSAPSILDLNLKNEITKYMRSRSSDREGSTELAGSNSKKDHTQAFKSPVQLLVSYHKNRLDIYLRTFVKILGLLDFLVMIRRSMIYIPIPESVFRVKMFSKTNTV